MAYLKLFHGRDTPDQDMEDWGEQGPVFGPYPFFHTTYSANIKFNDPNGWLTIVGDVVYYDQKYYGDWSVFDGPLSDDERTRLVKFDPLKAEVPK